MPDLMTVTVPITDVEAWNAMVDRLNASEPTPLNVKLTDEDRMLLATSAGQLHRIPV